MILAILLIISAIVLTIVYAVMKMSGAISKDEGDDE
jgi:hypothetical protein